MNQQSRKHDDFISSLRTLQFVYVNGW